ncbi:hypothetical protein PV08_12105 [Exophiala spinifera]|uniref:Uncharacterized protein n=1 Tax=Exophiala spinifera TaxID=91928 RepID=A0A0D2BE29_9EURO|nr:uncharacterized protein PV08_12105 [Exophiala spinifera]KIW09644.1 hypothetical protein PV08_12105 [Exophiala spinifera]
MAIILEAGRIQVDQVSSTLFARLPDPAQVVRRINSRLWGTLSSEQRRRMSDVLRRSLYTSDPKMFPAAPALLPLAEVFDQCFTGLAQVSFTKIRTVTCCDGQITVKAGTTPQRENSLYLTRFPLIDAVRALFQGSHIPAGHDCSSGPGCTRSRKVRPTVLDRLPPTLVIHIPPTDEPSARAVELFRNITFTYLKPTGEVSVEYAVVACVMMSGTAGSIHFTVVWNVENESYWEYNGMRADGRLREIDSWFHIRGRPSAQQVVMMVYRWADNQ